jgi:hypothetical protein
MQPQPQEWFPFPRQSIILQEVFDLPTDTGSIPHRLTVAKVTPEIAKDLLEHNISNRPFQPGQIDRLKSDMKTGEFDFNGSTLVLSNPLRLLDGQNRLRAQIETGVTLNLLFVEGVPPEVGDSLDQNVRRTVGHVLARRGIKPQYKGVISSAAAFLLQSTGRYHSPREVADYVEQQLEFLLPVATWAKARSEESPLSEVRDRRNSRSLSPGPLAALTAWALTQGADMDLWSRFVTGVTTGMSTNERDYKAFDSMRRRIVTAPLFGTGGSGSLYLLFQFGVWVHTYNRWVRGETIQVVRDYTQTRPKTLSELPKPSRATVAADYPAPAPQEALEATNGAHSADEVPDVEDMSQLDLRTALGMNQQPQTT